MSKIKQELEELRKEIAIQEDLIHDLYGSLIRHLNREIGDYSVTEKDVDSNAELRKKCFFLEIEIRERERRREREEKEEVKVIDMTGSITEEQREKFNAAQIGWGMRKVVEEREMKVLGKMVATPLIRPQSFISICGVEFDISGESLETIITEAIKLKLDVYIKDREYGLIKCPAGLYETENEKNMGIEEARKLKVKLEAEILETIQRFTTKTGIYVREIHLYGNIRVGCGDGELNMRVEAKTSL